MTNFIMCPEGMNASIEPFVIVLTRTEHNETIKYGVFDVRANRIISIFADYESAKKYLDEMSHE
jgi:hypothetical protein